QRTRRRWPSSSAQLLRYSVDRRVQRFDNAIDLPLGDHERRRDREHVAGERADDDALLKRGQPNVAGSAGRRVEQLLRLLVLHELDRAKEANPAHVADDLVRTQLFQLLLQVLAFLRDLVNQAFLSDDLEVAQANGPRGRVAAVAE